MEKVAWCTVPCFISITFLDALAVMMMMMMCAVVSPVLATETTDPCMLVAMYHFVWWSVRQVRVPALLLLLKDRFHVTAVYQSAFLIRSLFNYMQEQFGHKTLPIFVWYWYISKIKLSSNDLEKSPSQKCMSQDTISSNKYQESYHSGIMRQFSTPNKSSLQESRVWSPEGALLYWMVPMCDL